MTRADDFDMVHAANRDAWRSWLEAHAGMERGVWLVLHKKSSAEAGVSYDAAVEEALRFGWIDSRAGAIDETTYRQLFTPRKPNSAWAASNKARVARLIAEGRMAPAGLAAVEVAKANGSWDALNDVDALVVPEGLRMALDANPQAKRNFDAFPDSAKRIILFWIASAKRPETRSARIAKTAELAERNIRAGQ